MVASTYREGRETGSRIRNQHEISETGLPHPKFALFSSRRFHVFRAPPCPFYGLSRNSCIYVRAMHFCCLL